MIIPIDGLKPSKQVLEEFGILDKAELLPGGLSRAFLAGNIVVKYSPEDTEEEVVWLATMLDNIRREDFRVQKFIKSKKGRYLVDGWVAYEFLAGDFRKDIEHLKLKKEVLRSFHEAIKNESLPPNYNFERTDPWGVAEDMVWGERPIECHKRIMKEIEVLVDFLEPLELPRQLIQGDPGHVLFSDEEPPALIDLSWHYRPADFSLVVLAADALCCWCGDECNCLNADEVYKIFEDVEHFDQLLLKAVLRRVLEVEGHLKFDINYLDMLDGLKPAIDFVSNLFSRKT
ncbi:MAG: hypothetical protein HGN29_02280 [Asgard group archaeon]|nr:hypothetical protein [Asgard group archaeon]